MAAVTSTVAEHDVCNRCQQPCFYVCRDCGECVDRAQAPTHTSNCKNCQKPVCKRGLVCTICSCFAMMCPECAPKHVVEFTCCPINTLRYSANHCLPSLAKRGLPYGACSTNQCNAYLCPFHLVNSRNDPFDEDKWFCEACIKAKRGGGPDSEDENAFCVSCMSHDGIHCPQKCHEWNCSDCKKTGLLCDLCSSTTCPICYEPANRTGNTGACTDCKTVIVPGLKNLASALLKGNHYFSEVCNDIIFAYLGMFTSGSRRDMSALLYKTVPVIRLKVPMRAFFRKFARWMPSSLRKFNIATYSLSDKRWKKFSSMLVDCATMKVAQVTSETYIRSLNFEEGDSPGASVLKWWFGVFVQVVQSKQAKSIAKYLLDYEVTPSITNN
jgi:hypothetical protein